MAHLAITFPDTGPARRTSVGILRVLSRLAGTARFFAGANRAHKKALLIPAFSLLSSVAWSATPPNTPIVNTATANYSIGAANLTSNGAVTVNTAACIAVGVRIELLQYIPPARAAQAPATASNEQVQSTAYSPSGSLAGPYLPLANPTLLGNAAPTPLPANLLLAPLSNPVSAYSRNEPIFVRVTSYDANINPAVADTVSVTLTTTGGDSEVVQLTETGPSTGVFVGAVPSAFGVVVPNDGSMTVSSNNETITGTYIHSDCATAAVITSTSSALVDPYGIIFDSATGAPVNGATISLVDSMSNLPATVLCDDGVTVLTQPVTSGSPTNCDATMVAGGYRFPQVPATIQAG